MNTFSIATALSICASGATNESLQQMRKVLRHDFVGEEKVVHEQYQKLANRILNSDAQTKFSIANSAWAKQGAHLEETYLKTVAEVFDAEVHPLTGTGPINSWCEKKTNGLIKEIVSSLETSLVLVLINAIYFKSSWQVKFNKEQTTQQPFFTSTTQQYQVQMMTQKRDNFRYLNDSQFQMVELDYGNRSFGAFIILPRESVSVDDVIRQLSNAKLVTLRQQLRNSKGVLHLPRLDVSFGVKSLVSPLQQQGMTQPFQGDFDRIGANISISEVLHKAVVKLDEEGTEAAAVTAVLKTRCMVKQPTEEFYMNVNRPFLIVIVDLEENLILFLGKITKPQ